MRVSKNIDEFEIKQTLSKLKNENKDTSLFGTK